MRLDYLLISLVCGVFLSSNQSWAVKPGDLFCVEAFQPRAQFTMLANSELLRGRHGQNLIGIIVKDTEGDHILVLTELRGSHELLLNSIHTNHPNEMAAVQHVIWGGEIELTDEPINTVNVSIKSRAELMGQKIENFLGMLQITKINETSGYFAQEMNKLRNERHWPELTFKNSAHDALAVFHSSFASVVTEKTQAIPFDKTGLIKAHLFSLLNAWKTGNYRHNFISTLQGYKSGAQPSNQNTNLAGAKNFNEVLWSSMNELDLGLSILEDMQAYDPRLPKESIMRIKKILVERRASQISFGSFWPNEKCIEIQADLAIIINYLETDTVVEYIRLTP